MFFAREVALTSLIHFMGMYLQRTPNRVQGKWHFPLHVIGYLLNVQYYHFIKFWGNFPRKVHFCIRVSKSILHPGGQNFDMFF